LSTERVGVDGKREPDQPPLVPLTPEEKEDITRRLCIAVHDLSVMEEEHKAERDTRRVQRKKKHDEIESLASTLRLQGR